MLQPTGLHERKSTQFLLKSIGLIPVINAYSVGINYRKPLLHQQQNSVVKSKVQGS